ncbi:MAG: hypothetical protein ACLQMO_03780 [Acidobacteriaceae bacterium]
MDRLIGRCVGDVQLQSKQGYSSMGDRFRAFDVKLQESFHIRLHPLQQQFNPPGGERPQL